MNCAEVLNILDELDTVSLSPEERRDAIAHVSTCASCAEQWHASLDLGKLRSSVPAMSDPFRQTLKSLSSSAAASSDQRRKRRPVIVVGVTLVCAAAAAVLTSIYVGLPNDEPDRLTGLSSELPVPNQQAIISDSSAAASDGSSAPARLPETEGVSPVRNTAAATADQRRVTVAVLPLVHLNDDPASMTESSRYFREFLEPLDAHSEVIRIPDSELAEFNDPDLSLEEIGESITADFYVRFANEKPHGVGLVGDYPLDDWPEANRAFSVETAMRVRGRFGFGMRVSTGYAESTRWDAATETQDAIDGKYYTVFQRIYRYIRPDLRVPGFSEPLFPPGFGPGQQPGRMTEEDVRILIEQVRLADSPAERRDVWLRLRRSEHAAAVVPALTEAVLYDPVAGVRMAALDSLMGYLETPGVRETLQAVSTGDAPPALRERASMYLRTPSEHRDYTVDRLLDESLTDDERLAPLLAISLADYGNGSFRGSEYIDEIFLPNTSAVSAALIELATRAGDASTRVRLIERMFLAQGTDVVDQLLEFLANDPNEDVREAAVGSLVPRISDERVRAALEVAMQTDTSVSVQAEARDALQRGAR